TIQTKEKREMKKEEIRIGMEVIVPYDTTFPRFGTVTGILGDFCKVRVMQYQKGVKNWVGKISDVKKYQRPKEEDVKKYLKRGQYFS
ncbi:unnamed protein product, partial [marine sediment metagenome]